MPTYEYRCQVCRHEFEAFQMISEKPVENCPKCNGRVERIISGGAGFIFKGSGFYITDYRSSAYKADAAKEKSAVSNPSSDKSKTSDSKKSDKKNG